MNRILAVAGFFAAAVLALAFLLLIWPTVWTYQTLPGTEVLMRLNRLTGSVQVYIQDDDRDWRWHTRKELSDRAWKRAGQ